MKVTTNAETKNEYILINRHEADSNSEEPNIENFQIARNFQFLKIQM